VAQKNITAILRCCASGRRPWYSKY